MAGPRVRVRFAPSPSGSLHLGSALTAVANRRFADAHGGVLLLRIDDTDAARAIAGAEERLLADLAWLGVSVDEGPIRQSQRADRHRVAVEALLSAARATREPDGTVRFAEERRPTLVRSDGSFTYHLASVVDDAELGVTHVIRGRDHLPNTPLHELLARALGHEPPVYLHHGLLTGPDGRKLSKREGAASVDDVRAAGLPPEAVVAYLTELDLPEHDVQLDPRRLERLALDALAALPGEELAARCGAPPRLAPALRGARTLVEARAWVERILGRPAAAAPADERARLTLERAQALLEPLPAELDEATAHAVLRELKAIGGDLRSLRQALTGVPQGPELWSVLYALPRDEALARLASALQAS